MGYACPVCETPQADAGHLANHLAFTAMLGDDDHETWLHDHAPGWSENGERDLADRVVEHAETIGFPQVFEDTTEEHDHDGHDHDEPRPGALFEDDRADDLAGSRVASGRDGVGREAHRGIDADAADDPEVAEAMAEARELTRKRREDAENDDDDHEVGEDDTGKHAEHDDGNPADRAESQ